MLYIFHVDTGTTITFDIKLALQSVSQLMEAIERECGVVAAHQVLLMSGGECLEPNLRVCSYSAGTDTNPIYLFSKAAIESSLPPTPSIDYGSGGRLTYETLHANLNGIIPSVSTISRKINSNYCSLREGEFRFKELSNFLTQRNLPKIVWLSEDATKITGRVEYSLHENCNIGFVLPLNNDGLPEVGYFKATTYKEIKRQFQEERISNYAYVVMAQPSQDNTPSFCLSIFGTDNRFTASDVLKRWMKMQSMAKEFGITILGHSSDGDTRLMKAMKTVFKLPISENERSSRWSWFHCMKPSNSNTLVCQDTVHIGTKLRTRLLHKKVNLQIGNYVINKEHLEYLILNFGKDKHLLTMSDINGDDKMNFRAVEKICNPIVTNILSEKVTNAKGSVIYLETIRNVLNSFLNKNLVHRKRLFLIWKSVFIFRIWRNWILEQNNLTLSKNFITSNSYMSIEINAHFLVMLFQKILSDSNLNSSMCVPWLMSSQPCEQIFRSTRSLTSTFSTIVNFSLNDIMNRIKKIQIIQNVQNDLKDEFIFPREVHNHLGIGSNKNLGDIPDDTEIENIIMSALAEAKSNLNEIGINNIPESYWKNINCFPKFWNENLVENIDLDNNEDDNLISDYEPELNATTQIESMLEARLQTNFVSEIHNFDNDQLDNLCLKDYVDDPEFI